MEQARVLDVVEDRTDEAAQQLWQTLSPEQKQTVEAVAVDMWEPFIRAIEKEVPDADVVHDKYHVSSYLGKAVDQVRRQEHKELMAQGDETLKGSRQLWLYNPENFSPEQRSEFGALKDLHLKMARAWAAKELFSQFWKYQEEGWARRFFKGWYSWVSRSQLKPLVEVGQMLKRHLENLLTYLNHHITNAVTEGLNSKIQSIKAAAPRFPQLSELPHSHPFLLRKARSLPTMNLEESNFMVPPMRRSISCRAQAVGARFLPALGQRHGR